MIQQLKATLFVDGEAQSPNTNPNPTGGPSHQSPVLSVFVFEVMGTERRTATRM